MLFRLTGYQGIKGHRDSRNLNSDWIETDVKIKEAFINKLYKILLI